MRVTSLITDVSSIPAKAARDLIELVESNGWTWAAGDGRDSGDAPYVTVLVGDASTGEQYKITWHTRETGTYRLFSKIVQPKKGHAWRDAPSLKAIRERVTVAKAA